MPLIQEKKAETEGVLAVANAMAVAARTAPKTRGDDAIETMIVFGDELQALCDAMKSHGENKCLKFSCRPADRAQGFTSQEAGQSTQLRRMWICGLQRFFKGQEK